MKEYLKRTWKNKVMALLLLLISLVPIRLENDATMLSLMIIVIVPLFFAKRNYIE